MFEFDQKSSLECHDGTSLRTVYEARSYTLRCKAIGLASLHRDSTHFRRCEGLAAELASEPLLPRPAGVAVVGVELERRLRGEEHSEDIKIVSQ